MSILQRSDEKHGEWLLDGKPLQPDEDIEVFILGRWYPATVQYNHLLGEDRLFVLGKDMPILTDMRARRPAVSGRPKGEDELGSSVDDGPT